ncbi:hypothetical protein [Calothrix sp. NIES-2100]|uniref:hypothetical protein n=1 Tax=Calothrix sp. NIES-2100 TaxID=1954172 RepID=UPI0030DD11A3
MTSTQLLTRLKTQQYLPIGNISERVLYPLQRKGLITLVNTIDGLQITGIRK